MLGFDFAEWASWDEIVQDHTGCTEAAWGVVDYKGHKYFQRGLMKY